MRAGPLSNAEVVSLLNRYFVPVFTSNEDYFGKEAKVSAQEKAELTRINHEALKAKLSAGTVHAYVLTTDGHPIDSLHVARAAEVEQTTAMLQRAIDKFKPKEGKPLAKPAPQSAPPKTAPGALVLHLTARYLQRQGPELIPLADAGLGKTRNASWHAYPSENWIVYDRDEADKLRCPAAVQVGDSWDIDKMLAARLLNHFYPSTECNDVSKNRLDQQSLRATVVSSQKKAVRARLEGRLKLKHNFYPGREDGGLAEASVIGYLDFDPSTRRIQKLRLVTDEAKYAGHAFGVAVRSIP